MQYSELSPATRKILETLPDPGTHAASAPMLPRECYTSPEFFEFERLRFFPRSWVCVGREEQIPNTGVYLDPIVGVEPLLVARRTDGLIGARSAICRHRGQVIATEAGSTGRAFRCPLHVWTYDLDGHFMGAPYLESRADMECLRQSAKLPQVRLERWHGFLFVNLDPDAAPLAPSLAKVEPFWANYENADLVAVPPTPGDTPLPWNWKIHAENFTDAYHPEFVHRGTHDFAPSVHAGGGVQFTAMTGADNAIVRTVPLLQADGGMTDAGWGPEAACPAIQTLSPARRKRLTCVLIPPSMTLIFAPGAVAYQLITPVGAEATLASNDRVTAGRGLRPRPPPERNDFADAPATVREGAKEIWRQALPGTLGIQ